MRFNIIGSTGRTATTYLASMLHEIRPILACHEGYLGSRHDQEPLLPMINLENNLAFQSPCAAERVVKEKRNAQIIANISSKYDADVLVDIAYYNATLGSAVLAEHPNSRMIGIIREPEAFVRSATQLSGEDLAPVVGWPDRNKPLSDRERFIGMGRIRPSRGTTAAGQWEKWSAVQRNIWLWCETNKLLVQAKKRFARRVRLVSFELLQQDPEVFFRRICDFFHIEQPNMKHADALRLQFGNEKSSGYQLGPAADWSEEERLSLEEARRHIFGYSDNAC